MSKKNRSVQVAKQPANTNPAADVKQSGAFCYRKIKVAFWSKFCHSGRQGSRH